MVNIKTEFLREYTDQAISFGTASTDDAGVRPGPGLKLQASSAKLLKSQAASFKPQAARFKLQAASVKLLDYLPLIKFYKVKGEVLN